MTLKTVADPGDPNEEIASLIEVLHKTGERLEKLTGGEVDSVSDRAGRTFLLRRAQDRLRHSEASKQDAILNALPAHIAMLDARGVIVSVNESWRTFAVANVLQGPGYGIGLNYLDICDRADGAAAAEARQAAQGIRSVLAGSATSFSLEYPCHSPYEQRWFLLTVTPLADERSGAVVMHLNITDRRRAAEALRSSEREQRQFAEQLQIERSRLIAAQRVAKVGSWETDLATMSVIWSEETHRIFDTDPAIFHPTHQGFIDTVHPDDRAAVNEAFARSLDQPNGDTSIEHRLLLPNGRVKIVEERWQVVFDQQDNPISAIGTCQDITERKSAEEALRSSEVEFRTLAESMPQIVWITRADGWNIYFNQQWMDYTGLTLEQSLGEGWSKPFHPDDQQMAKDTWRQATATHGIYAIESRLRRADGAYRWWLLRAVPLQDSAGNILKWFGTCTDIHDLKVAELEIANANLELRKNEIRINYLNRVYAVLSGINTLIVRARDREELFREACRIALEQGGFRMALIAMLDHRGAMVPVASAGKTEELLAAVNGLLSSSESAPLTMVGRAIREKKPVLSNDSQNDAQVLLGKKYSDSGVRSLVVLPLIVGNEAAGVLALYAGEIEFFHTEEMKLLTELAGDIAYALDHLDKQERLNYLAYYDTLTGLANRGLFLERVTERMRIAASAGSQIAVYLLDLERFKYINDTLGQTAGDALLQQVAALLKHGTGDASLVARVGADQFAVMLMDVKQVSDLIGLIEKTTRDFSEHSFHLNDGMFRVACKVGAALFPADGSTADALFRNAEGALKRAKAEGSRYLFYTPQMTAVVAGRLALETQLRSALDNEEFVLHYQPKVNLLTGKLTSAEALIRWNDPRTGLVAPGRFIPILEETGLIFEVGRWALRKALSDYLCWRGAGLPAVRIAVNVSPLQLRNQGFVAEIKDLLGVDAHAPAGLELEITESVIMGDIQYSIATLRALRAMGITIAIDDFGTGFSSLSYLSKLPLDTLKIDRSFISDVTATQDGLALVSTIINLAHSLKLKVVAEGVETEEQSRLLRLLGCDEMQGFLFSQAVSAEVFEERFLSQTPVSTPSS